MLLAAVLVLDARVLDLYYTHLGYMRKDFILFLYFESCLVHVICFSWGGWLVVHCFVKIENRFQTMITRVGILLLKVLMISAPIHLQRCPGVLSFQTT